MGEYSAEDFAQATLATKGEYMVARRCGAERAPWAIFLNNRPVLYVTDANMVLHDWTPVVEARITEHALPDAQGNAARNRQRLVDHIADQDRVIRRRNDEITALRRELRDAQAPLSLESLAAAYEAAEQADECREGDVLIIRDDEDNYLVRRMGDRSDLDSTARILSRAPKPREPWADLADILLEDGLAYEEDIEGIVKRLYERGVTVSKNAQG